VVRPEERERTDARLGPVRERRFRAAPVAEARERAEAAVPRVLAERDDHAQLVERGDLAFEERQTGVALHRRRLVRRRRAAVHRADVRREQTQAVVATGRRRLVRQARPMQ
jgi:hypothetical protein